MGRLPGHSLTLKKLSIFKQENKRYWPGLANLDPHRKGNGVGPSYVIDNQQIVSKNRPFYGLKQPLLVLK